jgi:glycosyltransferase involved in cell wall biosynthesis
LFFGIIRKYKGLDLLLKAFGAQDFEKESLKLIVAGEFYDNKEEYLEIMRNNQLEDHIIFTDGFIPDEKVADYFCAADMIVQPYRNATQSGVTQIAYHFDKPMLVTDVGGLKETIPHNKVGYVVPANELDIKNAIQDFYQHNRADEFIAGVKEEKEKYSWQTMVDTIKSLYKNV